MMHLLRRLAECRKAATAVEYGLIVTLVVIAMIGALQGLASTTTGIWNDVSAKVQGAG